MNRRLPCSQVISRPWLQDDATQPYAKLGEAVGLTEHLPDVLRRLYAVDGVSGTQATVVLETFFERPVTPRP